MEIAESDRGINIFYDFWGARAPEGGDQTGGL